MASWQVQEAKMRFSELIKKTRTEGPQTITRHGTDEAIVLSVEDYRALVDKKPDFVAHLLGGPKTETFEIVRDKDPGRDDRVLTSGFLLDTNILSETRKVRVNAGVVAFLESQPSTALFLSVLTIGELRKGVVVKWKTDPDVADKIGAWLASIENTFGDRVLPIDKRIARSWGDLAADRTRPAIDTLLAATAAVHGLTLVTRNTMDFRGLDVPVVDPFTG